MAKMKTVFTYIAAGIIFIVGVCFGISSIIPVPTHAFAYMNALTKEIYAPTCLDQQTKTTLQRPCKHCTMEREYFVLGPIGIMRSMGGKFNDECNNSGAFSQDGRTLLGIILEYIGILPPLKSRWNPDGTWNW